LHFNKKSFFVFRYDLRILNIKEFGSNKNKINYKKGRKNENKKRKKNKIKRTDKKRKTFSITISATK